MARGRTCHLVGMSEGVITTGDAGLAYFEVGGRGDEVWEPKGKPLQQFRSHKTLSLSSADHSIFLGNGESATHTLRGRFLPPSGWNEVRLRGEDCDAPTADRTNESG